MAELYNQFKDFKSFEVVFVNKDRELQKIYCDVKSIEHDRIILHANNKKNNGIRASVGDEFKLHIYTENGIYSATSRILLASEGVINTEYVIAYPANSKHSQRREYFRADLHIPFRIDVAIGEPEAPPFIIEGRTRNICGKGMSYISDKMFVEHESMNITLSFKEREIQTTASLVYSKQIVVENRPKFIHAFTFHNISKQNIEFIIKQCFFHQLDLKKKS